LENIVALTTGTPDLGLDLRKVADLSDAATRKRLSHGAIVVFFRIMEMWRVRNEDGMALLGGMSNGRYFELKRTRRGVLTQDELTRISLLIGIFKALNILFQEKLAQQWISRPNSNPMFHNEPPLLALKREGVPGMISVRRLLDSRRGGR
jgi:uncharacterized protein (DUF2384 family)